MIKMIITPGPENKAIKNYKMKTLCSMYDVHTTCTYYICCMYLGTYSYTFYSVLFLVKNLMAFHLGGVSDVPNEIFAHAVHKATNGLVHI